MKNHYVSQLILKRFANALYIFDDNAKSISKHTQTENIFYKKDIYTDEVETAMNFNLENDFAKLLDKKVLGKNKITLTRTELLLLKRYLLVCSIKTKTPDEFIVSIRNFKSNTELITFHFRIICVCTIQPFNFACNSIYKFFYRGIVYVIFHI